MQLRRNEILTGLLVLATIAVLTGILILLGAPGLFRPLVIYRIYMDNAAGIKLGAPVLLAGRKIGQVDKLYSPVSKEDAARAEAAAAALHSGDPSPSPAEKPKYEARIDVKVDRDAFVYKDAKARLITLGLLGETAIDITQGNDSSGRASDGETFAGERVPDFGEAIAKMLDIVKPVATGSDAGVEGTANHLAKSQPHHRRKFAAQHGARAVPDFRRKPDEPDRARQLALDRAQEHRENQHRSFQQRQHYDYPAKFPRIVRQAERNYDRSKPAWAGPEDKRHQH